LTGEGFQCYDNTMSNLGRGAEKLPRRTKTKGGKRRGPLWVIKAGEGKPALDWKKTTL